MMSLTIFFNFPVLPQASGAVRYTLPILQWGRRESWSYKRWEGNLRLHVASPRTLSSSSYPQRSERSQLTNAQFIFLSNHSKKLSGGFFKNRCCLDLQSLLWWWSRFGRSFFHFSFFFLVCSLYSIAI